MRPRDLIFGVLAAALVVGYVAIGVRIVPSLSAAAAPTPTPTKPVEPVSAPQVPGRIAFTIRGDVYVLAGGAYRPVTSEGRSIEPNLSGDGALVFARQETIDGVRTVDGRNVPANLGFTRVVRKTAAGGAEEVLLDGLRQRAANGFHLVSWYLGPSLSPDGKRLAVTEDDGDGASDLEVVDLGTPGRRPVRVLSGGSQLADPAWSPDGKTIAVTSYNTDVAGILLWPADAGQARRVAGLPEGDAYRASYSPDGGWLVYTLRHDGANDVHAFEIATGRDVALTRDGRSWNGVFSPDGLQIAFLRQERQVVDLYAMELGGALTGGVAKDPRKLTRGEGIDGANRPAWGR